MIINEFIQSWIHLFNLSPTFTSKWNFCTIKSNLKTCHCYNWKKDHLKIRPSFEGQRGLFSFLGHHSLWWYVGTVIIMKLMLLFSGIDVNQSAFMLICSLFSPSMVLHWVKLRFSTQRWFHRSGTSTIVKYLLSMRYFNGWRSFHWN